VVRNIVTNFYPAMQTTPSEDRSGVAMISDPKYVCSAAILESGKFAKKARLGSNNWYHNTTFLVGPESEHRYAHLADERAMHTHHRFDHLVTSHDLDRYLAAYIQCQRPKVLR